MPIPLVYASYLIRMWSVHGEGAAIHDSGWHAQVEHIQTGERWSYTSVDDMLCFLGARAKATGGPNGPANEASLERPNEVGMRTPCKT